MWLRQSYTQHWDNSDPDHRCNKIHGGYWVAASIDQIPKVTSLSENLREESAIYAYRRYIRNISTPKATPETSTHEQEM